jgi:phosphatidylglycerol:prolipoprotein diacylglycerol transferase
LIAALAAGTHWLTYPNIDPVAFHVGPISIRWYGITYFVGALLIYLQLQSARSRKRTGMTVDQAQEFIVYGMIGVILGGRLLFLIADMLTPASGGGHPLSYYMQHPLELIAIWHGGMAFHGGFIGVIVAGALFVRRHRIAFYKLADETVLWGPVAIALTRVANYINGELPGRLTDSPIGVQFPDFLGYRYPSVLFEAAGMLAIVLPVMWLLHGWRARGDGLIWWTFVAGYGLVRTIVEFYREPGIVWLGLTAAQYLTIAMFLLGAIMMWRTQVRAAAPAAPTAPQLQKRRSKR